MFVFYLSFFLFFVMFRDPPNSTLTYPLFPSPTLFRSPVGELAPCARPNPAGTAGYEASNRRMGAGGRMKAQFLPVAAKRAIYVQKTCARLKPGDTRFYPACCVEIGRASCRERVCQYV